MQSNKNEQSKKDHKGSCSTEGSKKIESMTGGSCSTSGDKKSAPMTGGSCSTSGDKKSEKGSCS